MSIGGNENCWVKRAVTLIYCYKSVQTGSLGPLLGMTNYMIGRFWLALTLSFRPISSPALNLGTTNVMSELWYFKAEGSLEIFQCGGFIVRLGNKDQTGECAEDLDILEHQSVMRTGSK